MEVGHVLLQALLKLSSRSAVTSPFFLTLVQRLSRGAVEEGHSTAGDKKEIDWVFSKTPDRSRASVPQSSLPKREQAGFVLLGLWSRDPPTVKAGGAMAPEGWLWSASELQRRRQDLHPANGLSRLGLSHTVALGEVMKHRGGRLPEPEDGGPHLPTWPAAQEGLMCAGSSEPGHRGEKAKARPALGWFPCCSSMWAPVIWPEKTQDITIVTARLWGRGSWAREPGVVPSILPVRVKAWGRVDGLCGSTPNGQLISTRRIWL